jgi:hypothetical protein
LSEQVRATEAGAYDEGDALAELEVLGWATDAEL